MLFEYKRHGHLGFQGSALHCPRRDPALLNLRSVSPSVYSGSRRSGWRCCFLHGGEGVSLHILCLGWCMSFQLYRASLERVMYVVSCWYDASERCIFRHDIDRIACTVQVLPFAYVRCESLNPQKSLFLDFSSEAI